jgi:uncharacterized protein (DUF983 family)
MNVTRLQILRRGLSQRCPNCGERALFPPRSLRIHPRCPHCGVSLDRGEGFFLGPWVLNYTVSVFLFVLPAIVLGTAGLLPWPLAIALAVFGCLVLPVLLYRRTWSWWLMIYFYFVPERLPANSDGAPVDEED